MKTKDIRKIEMTVRHLERAIACLDIASESLYNQPRQSLTTGGTTYSEVKSFRDDINYELTLLKSRVKVFKELMNEI